MASQQLLRMSYKMGVCESIQKELIKAGLTNPYYERWKRGRPSKEAKEKRLLSDKWNQEQREKCPESKPFLSRLLSDNPTALNTINGKIKIRYVPRNV